MMQKTFMADTALHELLPPKNARVFSLLPDIVATIWLSPPPCLPLLFLLLFHTLFFQSITSQSPLFLLFHFQQENVWQLQ